MYISTSISISIPMPIQFKAYELRTLGSSAVPGIFTPRGLVSTQVSAHPKGDQCALMKGYGLDHILDPYII